jgi:hypothetical protein
MNDKQTHVHIHTHTVLRVVDGGGVAPVESVRERILRAAAKPLVTRRIVFFGTLIELRQPTARQFLTSGVYDGEAFQPTVVLSHILLGHCYVPGTNDAVFSADDVASLLEMPHSTEFSDLMNAYSSMVS